MSFTPDQIHAAARVFYESQTGDDKYDTSVYHGAWYRMAERALNATQETR